MVTPVTPPNATRRLLHVVKLIVVNVLVFVLLLCVIEFAHRTYSFLVNGHRFFREDTFISPWITTYDYPPPRVGPDGHPYFRHRATATSYDKAETTIRIIAVGGSTTANERPFSLTGIDYPIALEERFVQSEYGPIVEVLNAGGNAYSTAHSLINIEFRLVDFNPDIIVLMHNINDCSVNFFANGATSDYSNKYLKHYFLNPAIQRSLSVPGFLLQSRFLAKVGLAQVLAGKSADINVHAEIDAGLKFFVRNLVSINNICNQNNIRLVLLSQPSSMKEHPFVSLPAFLSYNKAIEDTAYAHEIYYIDMFTAFGHGEDYFVDDVHYSPAGIERFANILHSNLVPIVQDIQRQNIESILSPEGMTKQPSGG